MREWHGVGREYDGGRSRRDEWTWMARNVLCVSLSLYQDLTDENGICSGRLDAPPLGSHGHDTDTSTDVQIGSCNSKSDSRSCPLVLCTVRNQRRRMGRRRAVGRSGVWETR